MTLPQKNSPRIKTPYPYLMNLVSNYLEKNILTNTAKINGIQSRMLLKLRIKVVAFFLGTLYSNILNRDKHVWQSYKFFKVLKMLKHDHCRVLQSIAEYLINKCWTFVLLMWCKYSILNDTNIYLLTQTTTNVDFYTFSTELNIYFLPSVSYKWAVGPVGSRTNELSPIILPLP